MGFAGSRTVKRLLIHASKKSQILDHTFQDRKAVPHAGHKLIELQRAQLESYREENQRWFFCLVKIVFCAGISRWPILGFDADIGCKALDEIDGNSSNKFKVWIL